MGGWEKNRGEEEGCVKRDGYNADKPLENKTSPYLIDHW